MDVEEGRGGGGVVGVDGGLADDPNDLSRLRGGRAAGLRSMKVSILDLTGV